MMSRRALLGWFLPSSEAEAFADRDDAAHAEVSSGIEAATAGQPHGRIALQRVRPDAPLPRPGPRVAVVMTFACLNAGADFCATCVERCPVRGALRLDGRRVVVDSTACTGCGVCVPICPAPGGAILLKPAR